MEKKYPRYRIQKRNGWWQVISEAEGARPITICDGLTYLKAINFTRRSLGQRPRRYKTLRKREI